MPLLKHAAKGFTRKGTEAEGQLSVMTGDDSNKLPYATLFRRAT